ncbi:hypothetical protein LOK49_LG10G01955 [Camellia lanceoleosa]|uniref:Uncharacterized protein n=1 Tax=Camellia lanceoleosa TaxID=1840588 RepID=A0ACC0GBD6_9ERIC|nr:hypothetical protein LOK49_LG10G01955 [Camellia lanceoleosa]
MQGNKGVGQSEDKAQRLGLEELGHSAKGIEGQSGLTTLVAQVFNNLCRVLDSNQMGQISTLGPTDERTKDTLVMFETGYEGELGGSQYVERNESTPVYIGRGLSLVAHPLASLTTNHHRQAYSNLPQGEFERQVDLNQLEASSEEVVSKWVLSRISEVSRLLDVSFEGHETEALRLFIAVETS